MPADDDVVDVGLDTNADDDCGDEVSEGWIEDVPIDDASSSGALPKHSAFAMIRFNHVPAVGFLVKALVPIMWTLLGKLKGRGTVIYPPYRSRTGITSVCRKNGSWCSSGDSAPTRSIRVWTFKSSTIGNQPVAVGVQS